MVSLSTAQHPHPHTVIGMPLQLLPASAQAFAPRSAPTIVLNAKVEPWLTQTLKRINKIKRPLNSVPQHFRCLTETLGGPAAIWQLASLMLPKAPDSELRKDSNPLIEALFNFQLIHVEAYVVHIDMVSQHEVAFKLTPETIESLVDYHKDIYSVDSSSSTWSWPEKETQVKKMQDEFVQAANRFVFRTGVRALEGLEEEGAGELLDGRSEDVKSSILNLFQPLLPPPPRIVDVFHPAPILPNSTIAGGWWAPAQQLAPPPPPPPQPVPMDSWKVLPSTPSPTATSCSDSQSNALWQDMNHMGAVQLPSPTPSYSQPFSSASAQCYSSPECFAPIPVMPFPSMLPTNCGTDMGMGGYSDFGWSQTNFAPQYATTV
ncbi:hypothetical protein B0A50_07001 [Salinomyces thailandicus]|uniref:Uncharacterized protein n=1 Tax=Salinomyces thailandicus TaxID=706561 RepID=A0A4U0TPT2_9PEZI|nr:hypothetical protein B0A50_07001 [Salinomyces thailandica]